MAPSLSRGPSIRGRQSLSHETNPRSPSAHSHHSPFGGLKKAFTGGTLKGSVIRKNTTRKGSKSSKGMQFDPQRALSILAPAELTLYSSLAGGSSHPSAHAQHRDISFPINEHEPHHNHYATGHSMHHNDGFNGKSAKAENFFGVFLSLLRWKKKLILKTSKGKHQDTELLMACPFFRLDPFRYQRCLGKYELRRFSDVKQHLERCHSPGHYYCGNCQQTWTKEGPWNQHMKNGWDCEPAPPDPDKIPIDKLEFLKKLPRGASDAEKYRTMWKEFFPGEPPDPYLRDIPTEATSQLRQIQEPTLRHSVLPALLRKHGVDLGHKQTQAFVEEILAEAYNLNHSRPPAPVYRRDPGRPSLPSASPQLGGGSFISNSQPLHQSPEELQQPFQQTRIKPELSLECDLASIQNHQPQPQSLMEPASAHSLVHSPAVSIGDGFDNFDTLDGTTMNPTGGFSQYRQHQPSVDSYLSPTIPQPMATGFSQMSQHSQHYDNVSPTTVNLPIIGGPSHHSGPPSLISENGAVSFNDWSSLDPGPGPMKLDEPQFTAFSMQPPEPAPGIMVYTPAGQYQHLPEMSFPKCWACENNQVQFCTCTSPIPDRQLM
ncbi:unnamed protein product [Clonostachys solani]|uniref:C2H2-type domain-containing protein n=1 Tax=Clonostachys solani TaxID=160281 RepID=A0A9N9ZL53_9HYPO|nr:unnamed protein product [Clonostachys solani]